MPEQAPRPHRAVDQVVFLLTCGFLLPPFAAALVLNYGSTAQETAFTVFAPFVAAVILISLLLFVELIERVVAGRRQAWPPALLGIPLACIASAVSFSAVDPGHHWWRDGVAGAAWGTAVALVGWRRWRQRASGRASDGEASGVNGKRTTHVGPSD